MALARALVLQPQILLLDEPLAALDLQLRKEMQLELRALNRSLGITFILVTHDQEEALAMSDRVAVMSSGQVVQVGAPASIYQQPRTAFVARFIGEANLLRGAVHDVAGGVATVHGEGGATRQLLPGTLAQRGDVVEIAVRPEWHELLEARADAAGRNTLTGRVAELVFLGDTIHVLVDLASGARARVAVRNTGGHGTPTPWEAGQPVQVTWRAVDAQVLQP